MFSRRFRPHLTLPLVAMLLVLSPYQSLAWQPEADNLSSAAAASVVLYSLCDRQAAPAIAQQTAELLRTHAKRMAAREAASETEVVGYLLDSANRKVNAFWAANEAGGCKSASNLRALAGAYRFPLPN